MEINLDELETDNSKYVEIYHTILDNSKIDSQLYTQIYGNVYQLVNRTVAIEHKCKLTLYEKLNKTYHVLIKCLRLTVNNIYNNLLLKSFKNIDYNIAFIKNYNREYQYIYQKIKIVDDIFKYFHTSLKQSSLYKTNHILHGNIRTPIPRNFKEILNDFWNTYILQEFKHILNQNIIVYFNTIRKSHQLCSDNGDNSNNSNNSDIDINISEDILSLFNNIKKLGGDETVFDLYISKQYINNSNNYFEHNYKLELDLINDAEIFLQNINNILTFETYLSSIFTKYTQDGIKYNLTEMLICPKTSKLCKFMITYINNILQIITSNEHGFYRDNSNKEDIYQNVRKIKKIIDYILSIENVFEDAININKNIIHKFEQIVEEHLKFIYNCLLELEICHASELDFEKLLDYYQFLIKFAQILDHTYFDKSIHNIIETIVQNEKYQKTIIVNLITYLDSYFSHLNSPYTLDNVYAICTYVKEKDIFTMHYKRNLSKRIIKNKLLDPNKETDFIKMLCSTNLFIDDISHLKKIIDDFHTSQQNRQEYQMIYASPIDSYIITATYGIWQLQIYNPKEKYYCQNFQKKYEEFKTSYSQFYGCKYEKRTLKFYDNYNTCELEFNNYYHQTYRLQCHLDIADFLSQYNDCDSVPKSPTHDKRLIKYLLKTKLILEKENDYQFNDKCKFKKKEVTLNHNHKKPQSNNLKTQSKQSQDNKLIFQKSDYVESVIVRHLKQISETNTKELCQNITQKLSNKFTVDQALFDKCLKNLEDKEYLTLDTETDIVKYIP